MLWFYFNFWFSWKCHRTVLSELSLVYRHFCHSDYHDDICGKVFQFPTLSFPQVLSKWRRSTGPVPRLSRMAQSSWEREIHGRRKTEPCRSGEHLWYRSGSRSWNVCGWAWVKEHLVLQATLGLGYTPLNYLEICTINMYYYYDQLWLLPVLVETERR